MRKRTRIGCRSACGGSPVASSIPVMPRDHISAWGWREGREGREGETEKLREREGGEGGGRKGGREGGREAGREGGREEGEREENKGNAPPKYRMYCMSCDRKYVFTGPLQSRHLHVYKMAALDR